MSEELKPLEYFDAGKFIDYVWGLRQELDQLRAELSRIKAGQGEAVAWQFLDQDGQWYTGSERNNHRRNTEEAGYQVRELFAAPPTHDATQVMVPRELLERIQKELDVYHARDLVGSFGVDDELHALLAQEVN